MNADLIFTILGLTALARGLFGHFARSWDRMRSFFEQSLLRFAWLALAAIFGLSATTRPEISPPELQKLNKQIIKPMYVRTYDGDRRVIDAEHRYD